MSWDDLFDSMEPRAIREFSAGIASGVSSRGGRWAWRSCAVAWPGVRPPCGTTVAPPSGPPVSLSACHPDRWQGTDLEALANELTQLINTERKT